MTRGAVSAATHVRFPPRWQNTLVPVGPRSATGLGLTLYTASKPRAVLAQQVLWMGGRVLGSRVLPGPRETWSPPMDPDTFAELRHQWDVLVGGRVTGLAIYERLQPERRNLTLLVCAGKRSVLVRVRSDRSSLERERLISGAAAARSLTTFHVPPLVGDGAAAGYHWVAYEAIAYRPHTPVQRAAPRIFAEISDLVQSVVARPADVPSHWSGAHGDLNPWNLRRGRRRTWLIDWEDAGWAPPDADEVYFRAVLAALRPGPVSPSASDPAHREAARYWEKIVTERAASEQEQGLRERLLVALAAPG